MTQVSGLKGPGNFPARAVSKNHPDNFPSSRSTTWLSLSCPNCIQKATSIMEKPGPVGKSQPFFALKGKNEDV